MTDDAPAPPSGLRAMLPDLAPWRASRDFRRLWYAGLISNFGSFLTFVALPVQLKDLTDSAAAVGAIGAVELIPLLVFGLYGGALADAWDKRKLIVWTEVGQGLLSAALLLNALLPHPAVWPLYVVAALSSALVSVQRPALDSLWPRIVAHDHLPAAASLNSFRWTVGGVAGPALAGVVVAYAGLGWAYGADLLTFAVSVVLIARIAASPASHEAAKPSLKAVAEGARYAWSRKELLGTYAVDLAAMFLAMPLALLPFLADELDARWSLGLMYASVPLGALLVSLMSGWTSRVHRHGRMVVLSAALWGVAIAAAGVMDDVWLVLLFLTVAGGCDMVSGIFRGAMWNQTIPDELRGRLAGIELLSYSVGPTVGQVRAGGFAAWWGVRTSVWSGGLLCAGAVGLLALCLPKLMSYDVRTNEHATRLREQRAAAAPAPMEA
ncbi:MFS family permease [Streptomyces sp. SAI-208]|uniref:MFS transporter n=1 Tax=unclassified Streptomyces TaxID=2593676 RepID=UPI0024769033|nr:MULTISPECIES: MFS transporter [unclassified Streptomyces]MDH6519510.1 MFS family permease [Streptomyces sp. SAI-090]MDH6551719.1 MFS family permease [Streptomyces sp. SAI-041]MDH6570809.1 MFS family permease [Streptomyces sp. SAI-117]MDH6610483.1 MFS family permease [Streptomyces sp. SAI-208]MDH6616397.1 MFS family permease [Streptomyces sp. SAI-135]